MSEYVESQQAARALDAAHAAGDPFAATIRGARMSIVIADARQDDLPIIFVNDAFLKLTGYGREEVIGRNCRFLQGPDTDPSEVERIRAAIKAGREVSAELLNYRKDGTPFWNSLFLSPVREDGGAISYFFGSQFDVSERRAQQMSVLESREALLADIGARTAELERALEQKTALLHEVDHRVKNNLQLISSLMLLQTRRLPDDDTRKTLRGMLERVSAIATVHRRLFQTTDVTRFDIAEFIRDLTADLANAAGRRDVQLELELEHLAIPASQAAAFALVVNELIGNALKHAFPGERPGVISVSTRVVDDQCVLTVADDGVGMPAGGARGFGSTIIQLLSQQLRAKLTIEDAQPGVRAVVSIPVNTGQAL